MAVHKRFGPSTITHDINGLAVTYPLEYDWQHDRFFSLGEREVLADMVSEISSDDVVYDIGAYLGWHTVVAATAASDGQVVAFEPHPVSNRRLNEVVEFVESTVQTHEVALSNDNGVATVTEESAPGVQFDDADSIEVQTVKGTEYAAENDIPSPTVIKMDVEGAEVAALNGLSELLSDPDCRVVYCEVHPLKAPERDDVIDDVIEILRSAGFDAELFLDGSRQMVKATKSAGS
jgi:FkbM family methyltransferase